MWKPYTVRSGALGNSDQIIEIGLEYQFTDNNIRVYGYITDVFMISVHLVSKTDLLMKIIHNTKSFSQIKDDIEFVNKCYNLNIPIPDGKILKNYGILEESKEDSSHKSGQTSKRD